MVSRRSVHFMELPGEHLPPPTEEQKRAAHRYVNKHAPDAGAALEILELLGLEELEKD